MSRGKHARVARSAALAISWWLCAASLSACGPFRDAYTGPFRGPNELAIVTGKASLIGQSGYEDVFINSIDGKRAIGGWDAPTQEVHVLPGSHSMGLVEARVLESAPSGDVFKDQAVLRFKVIVGARYALGYNPATKEFVVVRVGLGPVPFEVVN